MKYFKLTQEQKQKIEDLNKSSKSHIIPQEYKDYWLVDCAYADEPMYGDFNKFLNKLEIVEIEPMEVSVLCEDEDLKELKNQVVQQELQLKELRELKAKLQAKTKVDTYKQSLQDKLSEIEKEKNKISLEISELEKATDKI